jgi:hypothetical protein
MGFMHWQPEPVATLCWAQTGSLAMGVRSCDARASTDIGLCATHYRELFGHAPNHDLGREPIEKAAH